MESGSVALTETVKRFETVTNYRIFRESLLEILNEAGFEVDVSNEKEANIVALGMLRQVMGDEKLTSFLRTLIPKRADLN